MDALPIIKNLDIGKDRNFRFCPGSEFRQVNEGCRNVPLTRSTPPESVRPAGPELALEYWEGDGATPKTRFAKRRGFGTSA